MVNQLTTITPQALAAGGDAWQAALADFLRLNVAEGDASPHTIRSIYTNLAHFTSWASQGDINPVAATDTEIREFRKALIERGYKRGTIAVKLAAVRRLYDAAVWRGLRADNPAAGIKAPREQEAAEDKIKFLPLEGFKRLLAAPDPNTLEGLRDRAIITMLGRHGLRVAEAASLTVADIGPETPPILSALGKRRKRRKIHLTDQTWPPLAAWLRVRAGAAPAGDLTADEPVFIALGNRSRGQRLTTRGIRHMIDGYLEACGLKADGVSCHSLRHSYATWAKFGGAKDSALQKEMGHTSIETTQVYAAIVDRIKENPARYLDALLGSMSD